MSDFLDLINAAAAEDDQSQIKEGVNFECPKPGLTVCRFIEYVELGLQKQGAFQGKPKPPCEEVKLTFELLNPARDIHSSDSGEFADKISFRLPKKLNVKAKFKKLFNQMSAGRDIKHMAQMLGQAFVVQVFNYKDKNGNDRASIFNDEFTCNIGLPLSPPDPLNPDAERKLLPVRAAISPLRLFLWNRPTVDTWNSLYIDGVREYKEDGVTKTKSKNFIQDMIKEAVNFQGSPIETMLMSLSAAGPEVATPAQNMAAAKEAAPVTPTQAQAGADALASLGF